MDFLNGRREPEFGDFRCPFNTKFAMEVGRRGFSLKGYVDWS